MSPARTQSLQNKNNNTNDIMGPLFQSWPNIPHQYQTSPYTPMINVPTTNRIPLLGELASSIDILKVHMAELSNKIDRIESRVNDWVNLSIAERIVIAEKGISALKTCHNEHSKKIATNEEEIDDVFGYLGEVKEHIHDNNKCIDRFSDVLTEHATKLRHAKHRSRNLAKKYAEVGILRRRVSKCEEFNTEFAECFDTPTELRGIIKLMSAQVEECDKTVSYIAGHNSVSNLDNTLYMNDFPLDYPTFCDGYETSKNDILPWDSIDGYFSNYADIDIESGNVEEKREGKEEETDKNNIVELTITSLRVDSNDGDDDYDYVEI